MGINTFDVLEAAGTKWNFLKFFPGLVGGHCIGVDPYYLLYKAKELGYHAKMIDSGRFINDSMGGYVAKQLVKKMIAKDINIKDARVLVMGVTFKEDVSDIRNSKVVDLINELKQYSIKVDVIDPQASHNEIKEEYGFDMTEKANGIYDGVVVAVQHEEYKNLPESYFSKLMNPNGIFVDLKGIYRNKFNKLNYWSL
jgi:UDP-N-acetyl-D-galactosamine dehydrogenase